MKQTTEKYVEFIRENHKDYGKGIMNGRAVADMLGISQGRVSQLIKSMREVPSESPQTMEQAAA
jgi:Mn-dependent DtxR family transcriptional regulator